MRHQLIAALPASLAIPATPVWEDHTDDCHHLAHRPRTHRHPVLREAHDGDDRPRQVRRRRRQPDPRRGRSDAPRPARSRSAPRRSPPATSSATGTSGRPTSSTPRRTPRSRSSRPRSRPSAATTTRSPATSRSAARPGRSRSTSSSSASTTGFQGRRAGFHATTKLNREDWGLTWNVALETGGWLVGKEIKLEIDLALDEVGVPGGRDRRRSAPRPPTPQPAAA